MMHRGTDGVLYVDYLGAIFEKFAPEEGEIIFDNAAGMRMKFTREGTAAGGLSASERAALKEELEELREKEAQKQRRQLSFEEGEGALVEDEPPQAVARSGRQQLHVAVERHLGVRVRVRVPAAARGC